MRTTISFLCAFSQALVTGIVFMFLWFTIDALRYFPVGEDSPTAIGFPVGLVIGIIVWWRFQKSFIIHTLLAITGLVSSTLSFFQYLDSSRLASEISGLAGLSFVFESFSWIAIFIGSICILLSSSSWIGYNLLKEDRQALTNNLPIQ